MAQAAGVTQTRSHRLPQFGRAQFGRAQLWAPGRAGRGRVAFWMRRPQRARPCPCGRRACARRPQGPGLRSCMGRTGALYMSTRRILKRRSSRPASARTTRPQCRARAAAVRRQLAFQRTRSRLIAAVGAARRHAAAGRTRVAGARDSRARREARPIFASTHSRAVGLRACAPNVHAHALALPRPALPNSDG